MDATIGLYCVVRSDIRDDVAPQTQSEIWSTFRWTDEFGNSIAPFFSNLEASRPFLKAIDGWEVKHYPVSFVVAVILADIRQETSFYAIDPQSIDSFKALSPVQFLTELVSRKNSVDRQKCDASLDHQPIVPVMALFGDGIDQIAQLEYRRLLADADLIFGIDLLSGKQSIVYGRLALKDLLQVGHSKILSVVNVGIDDETIEIETLAALVKDIKGNHDYFAAGSR